MLNTNTRGDATLACEVCLKEIPHSVGQGGEGQDYVYHFCGDACYSQWLETTKVESVERSLAGDHALG
jgi:hypothetical protein